MLQVTFEISEVENWISWQPGENQSNTVGRFHFLVKGC